MMERRFLLYLVLLTIPVLTIQTCPDGYNEVDGRCFFVSDVERSFEEAKYDCMNRGGSLVVIDDAEDREDAMEGRSGPVPYWISPESEDVDFYSDVQDENCYICEAPPGNECAGAPIHPKGYIANCGAAQPIYPAGHTCVFTCPYGYVKTAGDMTKVCVNGQWEGEDLVCEEIVSVTTFLNPHDIVMVEVAIDGGNVIQVQGEKTDEGTAISVESLAQSTAGGDETTVGFDPDSGLFDKLVTSSGVSMTFMWTAYNVCVIATTQNFELNVVVDLEEGDVSPGSTLPVVTGAATGTSVVPSLRLPVQVNMCEHPTEDVTVEAFGYKGLASATDVSSLVPDVKYKVLPKSDAGQFEIVVPAGPADTDPDGVCDSVSQAAGGVCAVLLNPVTYNRICSEVADATKYLTTNTGTESPLVLAACLEGFDAANCFCNSFGFVAAEDGAIESPYLCQHVTGTVDSFSPDPVLVVPKAVFTGGEVVFVPGEVVSPGSTGQTLPAFSISSSISAVISSVTITPRDPIPGQNYVVYATFLCTDATTVVTMTIVGTDGYTDQVQCPGAISDCTLYVPGAEALVVDLVTVSIHSGGLLVISREYVIVF